MNNPSDGTGRMWALERVRPMFGRAVLTPIRSPLERDQQIVLDSSQAAACRRRAGEPAAAGCSRP